MTAAPAISTEADPVEHPDPARAADAAAAEAVLRCWVREAGLPAPADGVLRIPLAGGGEVTAPVRYWSAVGIHRFGLARLGGRPVPAPVLAALVAQETGAERAPSPAHVADVVERSAESVRRIATILATRRAEPPYPAVPDPAAHPAATDPAAVQIRPLRADLNRSTGVTPFLDAEQGLLLGHLTHPAAKSRDGISDHDARAWSPELRGSFPLHWFAARREVVTGESLTRSPALGGRTLAGLCEEFAGTTAPAGTVLLPAHPWQSRDLLDRPAVAALLDAGLLEPLGPLGPRWYPTSSLRTVYRPDAPVMLKLSLGLRITNSRRENTRIELRRGVEVHRLLDGGLGAELAAEHPRFAIVRDPAWLAVFSPDDPAGRHPTHLDVSAREVPFGAGDVRCLAGLVAPRPGIGPSRVAGLVRRQAAQTGRRTGEVAAEWLRRYLTTVLAPMIWLYARHGIGLEAHQQNTLVRIDQDGWPDGGYFRDNQGYYLAESAHGRVLDRLADGSTESTLALCPDLIVDDRLGYYLLFNNVFGLLAALSESGTLADEHALLGEIRAGLAEIAARWDSPAGMVRRWLDADTLPCKANLFTQLAGVDEVLAPVDNQSVYLDVPNPLRAAR